MSFKLNDAVAYLENTLGSNGYLRGNVTWTNKDTATPPFKDYGVHAYLGNPDAKEVDYRSLGARALERWKINCDFVLNKNFKPRVAVSDTLGLSYWENYLFSTLFHKQNNGTFHDSWWDSHGIDDMADSHIIRGIFTVEMDNQY